MNMGCYSYTVALAEQSTPIPAEANVDVLGKTDGFVRGHCIRLPALLATLRKIPSLAFVTAR